MSLARAFKPTLRLVCYLFFACLLGCEQYDESTIRFGLPQAVSTLDPRYATDAISDRLTRLLHPALVEFDHNSQPIPGVAAWQALTPQHYRFSIIRDYFFSNNERLVATDIVATYRAVLDADTASPHRASLRNIAAVRELDDNTVDFYLHKPDALFPGKLVVGILAEKDLAQSLQRDAWQLNAGPFLRVSSQADGRTLLQRRHDQQLFAFLPLKDPTVRALKLISGEIDLMQGNISPELFDFLSARDELNAARYSGSTMSYIGFNLRHPLTGERDVRLAIAHAIDREAIIKHVFQNTARLADGLFPPEHWVTDQTLSSISHDPLKARQILAARKDLPQPLILEYKTSTDPLRVRIATIFQQQLAAVGIELRIRSLDWGTFYGDIKNGRFELYALSWVGLRHPDIFRYALHSESLPPNGANRGAYRSIKTDTLIETAENSNTTGQRLAALHALQQHLLYDLPFVPLWFEDQLVVSQKKISGYSTTSDGRYDALKTASK